ncbi:heat-inducible transcriptional repressor HrcA [Desulfoplanes sp.]
MELCPREIDVLTTIVEEYIATARPVGSRVVAKKSRSKLSPASIRNIMADLADQELLDQPHTSAGRIPTIKGLRFFLDSVLQPNPLSGRDRDVISDDLYHAGSDPTDIFRQTSKVLSSISQQACLVLGPSQGIVHWKHIDFVLLTPGKIMSILVLQGGIVQNKIIDVDTEVTPDDLFKYANFLNSHFQGQSIHAVQNKIRAQMKAAQKVFDVLYQRALDLADQTCSTEMHREIFVEGASNLLSQPDFTDLQAMRDIFKLLEERSRLLELVDTIFDEQESRIILGQERSWDDLEYCCLVSSPYTISDQTAGMISIIGPVRMDYAKIIPMVDFTAQVLSKMLQLRF